MKQNVVEYYKALSNPVRLKIYLHIADKSEGFTPDTPHKDSCVTEMTKTLKVPQPTVSNHIRVLEKAGLIKAIHVDTHSYSYITKKPAQQLLKHTQYIYEQAHANPY